MAENKYEVILIGGGIMSATLGTMLKELDPALRILLVEKLDEVAEESSDAWNNAGTGHSAFCELNYTPETPAGIEISKAIKIADAFETSKEFWSYLVEKKYIKDPDSFIKPVPHMSCVWGDQDVSFLRRRYETMVEHPLFREMVFSSDRQQLKDWMPLMMEGRPAEQVMAATLMSEGTDVNFGSLTRSLVKHIDAIDNFDVKVRHEVKKLKKKNKSWRLKIRDYSNGSVNYVEAPFVFIGAGGAALTLLEKSHIVEGRGYGGFPVSGQWLICNNESIISRHDKKVYGKATVGTPPMSVPHLDTRIINGKRNLLFGPFAGFTTKFLKQGSVFDLIKSIRFNNIIPMIAAGIKNIPLTKYLVNQVTLSDEERLQFLRLFVPEAKLADWKLENAGQRVQIIKKDKKEGGVLEFGTELVISTDASIAALLGASPGASVSVSIMLDLLTKCFPQQLKTEKWKTKLKEMIPSYGMLPKEKESFYSFSRKRTNAILKLGRENLVS